MKNRFLGYLALAGLMATAACGGGGGAGSPSLNSLPPSVPNPPPSTASKAKQSLTFTIPIATHSSRVPSSLGRSVGLSPTRKPMFISAFGNGGFTVIFDGQTVINNQSFAPPLDSNGNVIPGPGPTGTGTMANGGSFSYTSTFANGPQGGSATVSATYTTIPGAHTIGVVQTDGACIPDIYGRELCIPNTNGFVLAEGQNAFTLQPGSNTGNVLVLKGVMQSAYLCDAACDGQTGPADGNGVYHLTAFASDEAGDSIVRQIDPVTNQVVPFDNGSYEIVETDGNNIVTLGQAATSYSTPGNASASGPYGENFTIACSNVGTATVAARLLASDPSQGSVTGFTYTSQNYPQAGSILSTVGADEYFGNTLTVNCSASGSLTIE